MSEETVQEVIIKAVSDPEFRELLFSDPDKALDGYELTEEEVESLKHVDRDSFEENLSELEERVSRVGMNPLSSLGVQGNLQQTSSQQTPDIRNLPSDKRSDLDSYYRALAKMFGK